MQTVVTSTGIIAPFASIRMVHTIAKHTRSSLFGLFGDSRRTNYLTKLTYHLKHHLFTVSLSPIAVVLHVPLPPSKTDESQNERSPGAHYIRAVHFRRWITAQGDSGCRGIHPLGHDGATRVCCNGVDQRFTEFFGRLIVVSKTDRFTGFTLFVIVSWNSDLMPFATNNVVSKQSRGKVSESAVNSGPRASMR